MTDNSLDFYFFLNIGAITWNPAVSKQVRSR